MAKITYELLCAFGACKSQADTFKTLFPNGVEVTEELCREHAHTFNWGWAVRELLTSEATELYKEKRAQAFATAYLSMSNAKESDDTMP